MFWSYRDESEEHLWKVSFVTRDAVTGEMLKGKGQNNENFRTTNLTGNKGEILCGVCFFKGESCGFKQWGVSACLSSSPCDKTLAPGHLPKWRGLSGCLYRELHHSIPQLNKTISHNKRAALTLGGSPVQFLRLLTCTLYTGTALSLQSVGWLYDTTVY